MARKRIYIVLCIVAAGLIAWAAAPTARVVRNTPAHGEAQADTAPAAERKLIRLIHSDSLCYREGEYTNAKRLVGSVVLKHENALLFCDSAYLWEEENSIEAYGRVRMIQGDSIMASGGRMSYDGNTRLARLSDDVRIIHRTYTTTILAADSMVYDRARGVAHYDEGGVIRDDVNTLRSVWGEYTPSSNQSVFRHNVHLIHPNFTLSSDTLYYNTSSHVAKMEGPTNIEYENETHIFTTRGWYNTETEQSMLLNRSIVTHLTGQTMTGDTIFYDKRNKFGRLYGQMHLTDSTQHKTLYGNYGEMWEKDKHGWATRKALIVDWADSARWIYVHADTLETEDIPYRRCVATVRDSLTADSLHPVGSTDTTWIDTVTNRVQAHRHVRIWREEVQAVCDSLSWVGGDSTLLLYIDPICWNKDQQVSADTLRIRIRGGEVDRVWAKNNALAIRHEIRDYYNQCAGKEIIAYLRDDTIRQVDINGNAMTVFFPKEDDGSYVGMNTTQSNFIKVYLVAQEVDHLVFTNETQGLLYPMHKIEEDKSRVPGFFLAPKERPKRPGDVMLHPKRTPRPRSTISATSDN